MIETAPSEAQPADESRPNRPAKGKPRSDGRRDAKDGPVIGMGDHVPDFLTRGS